MEIEKVQKWVMSGLLLTTALIFSVGLTLLTGHVDRAGSTPGLTVIACVVGLLAVGGVRAIHGARVLSPVLLLGVLPALVTVYLVHRG